MLVLRLGWEGGQPAPLQKSSSLWAACSLFSLLSPEGTFTSDPPRTGPKQGFSCCWSWQDGGWACHHAPSSSDPAPQILWDFFFQLIGPSSPPEGAALSLGNSQHPSCTVSFPSLPVFHLLLKFRVKPWIWRNRSRLYQHSLPLHTDSTGCHIISSLQACSTGSPTAFWAAGFCVLRLLSGRLSHGILLPLSLWNAANFHQQKRWMKFMSCSRQEMAPSVSLEIHQCLHVNPAEPCQELIKKLMSKINSQMKKWASKLTDWLWESLPSQTIWNQDSQFTWFKTGSEIQFLVSKYLILKPIWVSLYT